MISARGAPSWYYCIGASLLPQVLCLRALGPWLVLLHHQILKERIVGGIVGGKRSDANAIRSESSGESLRLSLRIP